MSDSIVIIPTYNEKENIEKIIRAIFSLPKAFDILVIDDGSPDGTAEIVRRMIDSPLTNSPLIPSFPEGQKLLEREEQNVSATGDDLLSVEKQYGDGNTSPLSKRGVGGESSLFLLERSGKLGLGTAYIMGFKWALERDYQYIFEMDADFSHDPKDLPRLYEACAVEGYDVAIGSRYVSGVNVVNWPIGRVLMSYFASKYVKFVTGFNIHDTTAGFKCYRRRVLETIELDKIRFKGYAFQIEMKYTAYKIGFKIKEVPVIFVNRVEGVSKMSGGIFGEAFFGVMRLRFDGWFRKYPALPKG